MSPQDFMEEMDDGELVCFIGKKKPFRLKSMDARRHPLLAKRLGKKLLELLLVPPHAQRQQNPPPAPKPPPLQPWHFDPQLFRKWPQFLADNGGEGENLQETEMAN
jgi:hypothetical protein